MSEVKALLQALQAVVPVGKIGSELNAKRGAHLQSLASRLPPHMVARALNQLVIWDRLDEASVRGFCRDLLLDQRVPLDRMNPFIDALWLAARTAAEVRREVGPQLHQMLERARQKLLVSVGYVSR